MSQDNRPKRYKEYRVLSLSNGKIKDKVLSDRGSVSIYEHEAEMQNLHFKTNKFWYELDLEFEESVKADEPDREALKAEADELGLDYPKNIKTGKLIELIEKAK